MSTIPSLQVGPVRVHDLGFDPAAQEVLRLAEMNLAGRAVVVTPNGQHLDLLHRDRTLMAVYGRAELVLPDGWPVVLAMKWRGAKAGARVTGADLLPTLCAEAAARGITVGLLGGKPGVAARAAERLVCRLPDLKLELVYSPPLGFEQDDEVCREMTELVEMSGVQLLFVGLGAPKQELFADRWLRASGQGVSVCVGAAIDFIAGEQTRAPEIWRKLGAEWLYRMLHEPRRLAGRYARTVPVVLRVLSGAAVDRLLGGRR
jgi:N-acetylglucosaminyldiphosphoundecaprenol N-acetyl-beta-D-mannosaminyltransferase